MPIPNPRTGEDRDEFASRCIPVLVDEGKEPGIASAICFAEFDRQTEAVHQKKRRRKHMEAGPTVPGTLNCDPVALDPDEVMIAGAALLHSWAHRLWTEGLRGQSVVAMHQDAIDVGEAVGISHDVCDDLDALARGESPPGSDPGPG